MHEITVSKMDTDKSFRLTFTPLDGKGQPTSHSGAIVFAVSNEAVATAHQPSPDATPADVDVTITGTIGNCDITVHDDKTSVVCHLIVSSGVETDATLIVSRET